MFFRYKVEKGGVSQYHLDEFDAIVIGGGGLKGLAFLGAIQYFQECGLLNNVKMYAGTSAGSIISLLLVLGISPKEQLEMNVNSTFLKTKPLNEVFKSGSLMDYSILIETVHKICIEKMNISPTFLELFNFTGKSLRIVSYNVTKHSQHVFSETHSPDVLVADAIRYSCALPIIFEPQMSEDGEIFLDGGLINNLPVDVVKDDCDKILAISTESSTPFSNSKLSFADIVQIIISVPTVTSDLQRIDQIRTTFPEKTLFHVQLKHSYRVSATIGMTKEEKVNCFETGYNFAKGI